MNLDSRNYAEFKLSDIFHIKYGVNLELNACIECKKNDTDAVNFVARTAENNGVSAYVKRIDNTTPQNSGLISVAGGGSVLSTFLQNKPFYSGRDLYTLESKKDISDEAKLFVITIIEQNKYKYSYGRQANKTLQDLILKLPVDKNGSPDWRFMEDYIKSLHHKPLTTKNKTGQVPKLNVDNWGEFRLDEIFLLKGGFYNKKPEHSVVGKIPFLASTENNNGVTEYYSIDDIQHWDKVGCEDNTINNKIYEGNCIAVTVNGSVCNAYYQDKSFTCSHDITTLYVKNYTMNPYLAQFLCTIIMQDKYRWSYGRKPHDVKKFGRSIIKLPINSNGSPDWQFMEDYIKALPYGDRLEG